MCRYPVLVASILLASVARADIITCSEDRWCVSKYTTKQTDRDAHAGISIKSRDGESLFQIQCALAKPTERPVFWLKVYSKEGLPPNEVTISVFGSRSSTLLGVKLDRIGPNTALAMHPRELFQLMSADDFDVLTFSWGSGVEATSNGKDHKLRFLEIAKDCGVDR